MLNKIGNGASAHNLTDVFFAGFFLERLKGTCEAIMRITFGRSFLQFARRQILF